MTDGRLAGLGRETLLTETGRLRVAGLVRETLISGIGVEGTSTATSGIRATLSLVTGGAALYGTAKATSRGGAGVSVALVPAAATRIKATSSVRSPSSLVVSLAGRIKAESSAAIDVPGRIHPYTRIGARSSVRGTLSAAAHMAGRAEATSEIGTVQLPLRVNMTMRTTGSSRASAFIPIPVSLPGGRIGARSRASIYFAPRPPSALSEAVSLVNV